jgi:hypothetical protein
MGAGLIAGIAFFSLAGYIARLAMRGLSGHGTPVERRPMRHRPPRQQPPAASTRKTA